MTTERQNPPSIAILDYGMGNLRSVHRAFLAVGAAATLVRDPAEVRDARALVFPGQGAIMDTMRLLQDRGWDGFIRRWIDDDRPFFGICLGLQALFDFSEEGDTPGLGVFRGKVQRFRFPGCPQIKIPHMGWNAARFRSEADALLQGIVLHGEPFYFVHSFHVVADDPDLVWATTEYGGLDFCSAIRRGNLVATQFHPEKSQSAGLQLYRNFVAALPG